MILVLFLGFIARLYKIDNPVADWHSWRQADTASVSRIYVEKGINPLLPRYHDVSSIQSGWPNPNGYRFVEFPLYNIFHAFFYKMFPQINFEIWGRLVSSFSAIGTAYLLYLISREYFGEIPGVLSAFFYLMLPYNIYFTRVILPEPLSTFLAVFALYAFIKFIEKEKFLSLFLSGIFLSLAVLVKPHAIFFSVPMVFLAIEKFSIRGIFENNRKIFIKLLLFSFLVFLPFLLWRAWLNQFYAGIPFMEWSFNGDKIRFHPAFWRWIFNERLAKMILGMWGTSIFVLGIINKKARVLTLSFLLGMFVYVSTFATANVRHDYYQIFIVPAVCVALASGVDFLIEKTKNLTLSFAIILFVIVLSFGSSFYQIKDFYQINHPEIIEAGKRVDEITPKDSWVIAPYNGDTAFLYQTGRWGWPAVDDSFDKIIEKGADFYVSVNLGDSDTAFVREKYKVIEETEKYLIADLHERVEK